MDRVVIFGVISNVGVYLSMHLHRLGYDVIAVSKRESDNGFFQDYGIPYYSIDITQRDAFSKLPFDTVDHVINCDGSEPSNMEGYRPKEYISSIISGMHNVLDYCLNVKSSRIIYKYTSQDSEYLMGSKALIPADIARKPPLKGDHAFYAVCKIAAANLAEHYSEEYGLKSFILRPPPCIYAYNPSPYFYVDGHRQTIAYRLLIEKAMKSEPIEIWGDPGREKEILYVKDFVQAIAKCLVAKVGGGVYNVGRGVGVTLEEQIKGIIKVFSPPNHPSIISYRPDKPDARQLIYDISKTRNELGYNPEFNYQAGLHDFKKEMETNPFCKLWSDPRVYARNN